MSGRSATLERFTKTSRGLFFMMAVLALVSLYAFERGIPGTGGGLAEFNGRRLLVVTSGSMSPAIHVGDAVLVRPVASREAESFERGDVVTFRAANNPRFLITHRIVAVRSSAGGRLFYETKGDANADVDGSVLDPGRIQGVVTRVIPRLGSVLLALHTRRVVATFLLAFVLLELAFAAFRAGRSRAGVTPELPDLV